MKAHVDQDTCTGCGLCADTCPQVFTMEGDVAVVTADPVAADAETQCQEAMDDCPVGAITIE